MHWLQTLDVELFRFINRSLSNPVFDAAVRKGRQRFGGSTPGA